MEGNQSRNPFLAEPPRRLTYCQIVKFKTIWKLAKKIWYFTCLTVTPFEPRVVSPSGFDDGPYGDISQGQLSVCKSIYDEANDRITKIDQKATAMLSAIAVFIPLMISALVLLRTSSEVHVFFFVTGIISVISLTMAFVAVYRALSIRGFESMFLNVIVDKDTKKVKDISKGDYGKGLLYCASVNQALNDHRADFVRASQTLSMIAVFFLALSATPALYSMSSKNKTQEVKNTGTNTSANIEADLRKLSLSLEIIANDLGALKEEVADINRNVEKSIEQKERIIVKQKKYN